MPKKAPPTFAQRVKKVRFGDDQLDAHKSLADEDGAAWVAAVVELDGFAESASKGATGLMAWMLEKGISPDARPADKGRVNSTPPALMQVLRSLSDDTLMEWVERLLAAGADASLQHPDPRIINPAISRVSLQTPLAWALERAPLPLVARLSKAATDSRVRVSAVAFAMSKLFITPGAPGYPDSVPEEARRQFVMESILADVDVNTTTFDGRTLLHIACALRSLDAVKALLAAGANPNAACEREWQVGYTRVVMPAGAKPIEVLRAHRDGDQNVAEIRESLTAAGAAATNTERERPAFASAAGALLDAHFGAEVVAKAYQKLPAPTDAFSYLLGLSAALPPPEALARFTDTNELAFLLYKPRHAPYIDANRDAGEVENERSGTREWSQLLKRSSFAKHAWDVLEHGAILSYWPGHGDGIGDVLVLARLPVSTERTLVRVSTSDVTVVGACEPLCRELLQLTQT